MLKREKFAIFVEVTGPDGNVHGDIRTVRMAKQIKIKEIAARAGVSPGTVDRVLHNRGNVSAASREAVERVLAEVKYRFNIHASAISLRKEYNIVAAIPTAVTGEYWGSIRKGIERAVEEYSDIRLNCTFAYYNQFDIYSCRSSFDEIAAQNPDAVILGATFVSEARRLCELLEARKIPYVFVDSRIEQTRPIASFATEQSACGHLCAKLLDAIAPPGSAFAIFNSKRIGNENAYNMLAREEGFRDFFAGVPERVTKSEFSVLDPEEGEREVLRFLAENPRVRGIAVMNSRGHIIADILRRHGIQGVRLISFDTTANNIKCINEGSMWAVLCQYPEMQGFQAMQSIIGWLLYKRTEPAPHRNMPIGIVVRENLPYHREFLLQEAELLP